LIRRRQLARRLQALRQSAGYSLETAAATLEWSPSKLSRIENALQGVDIHSVRGVLDVYDLGGDEAAYIQDLTRAARGKGGWREYGLSDDSYVAVETEASAVRSFEPAYVPGLLQTPEYTRTLFVGSPRRRTEAHLDDVVAARMVRQRRLTSAEAPLELMAIVDEAVLRRPIGGPAVWRPQLEHLLITAELDTVTLRVLPFRVGMHLSMDGAFSILSFGELEEPDVVAVQHAMGTTQHDKEEDVARAELMFDKLRLLALSPTDTMALVSETLDRA